MLTEDKRSSLFCRNMSDKEEKRLNALTFSEMVQFMRFYKVYMIDSKAARMTL